MNFATNAMFNSVEYIGQINSNPATKITINNDINLQKISGAVQSRINIANGPTRVSPSNDAGFEHVIKRHFSPEKNAGQFTISQSNLEELWQQKHVIDTPVFITLGQIIILELWMLGILLEL